MKWVLRRTPGGSWAVSSSVKKDKLVDRVEVYEIDKVKEIQKTHAETSDMNDLYFVGMYNGLELALAILENRDAQYKDLK